MTAIGALDDAQLQDRIGDVHDRALGSGVSRYVTLHGMVQHHVYHDRPDLAAQESVGPSRPCLAVQADVPTGGPYGSGAAVQLRLHPTAAINEKRPRTPLN